MERANSNQTKKRQASSGKRFGGNNGKNKVGTIGSMILMNGPGWGWFYTPDKNRRKSYIAQVKSARKRREILKRKSH